MRLGLPLPGYCEVMAVTRVTAHIYISISRVVELKYFPQNYFKVVRSHPSSFVVKFGSYMTTNSNV